MTTFLTPQQAEKTARDAGYLAGHRGLPASRNPYPAWSMMATAWEDERAKALAEAVRVAENQRLAVAGAREPKYNRAFRGYRSNSAMPRPKPKRPPNR
jgi:hypothetical protein